MALELTGIVLGAIPIALTVLDNYRRCLPPAKAYWKYDSTLSTIRTSVFIQQEQLNVTLHNLGLDKPTTMELEEHLNCIYPKYKCAEFMSIITRMEEISASLLEKLQVDINGKPKWTSNSERTNWEWRRIKRSFGRTERNELLNELQHWNNCLKNVFEKAEIVSYESDPLVKELQARFNQKHCDTIRNNVRLVHKAVSKAWTCNCPEHQGHIHLDWHMEKITTPGKINVTFSTADNKKWHSLSLKVESVADSSNTLQNTQLSLTPPPCKNDLRPPSPSKIERWKEIFKSTSVTKGPSVYLTPQNSTNSIHVPPSFPLVSPINISQQVFCLCHYLRKTKQQTSGFIANLEELNNRVIFDCLATPRPLESISLEALLTSQATERSKSTTLVISRKERFAIAASAAWAALYLCGSPWLSEDWSGKNEMQLFLEDEGKANGLGLGVPSSLNQSPTLSYKFRTEPTSDDQRHKSTPEVTRMSAAERFQSSQIRNKTLFALGILLIELCLNISFEQLRRENQAYSEGPDTITNASPLDDFEIADRQIDRIFLEAGDSYGDAVRRCIRCDFPGRDVTKSFDFQVFRKNFFDGVVAPVQATFQMLPTSFSAF